MFLTKNRFFAFVFGLSFLFFSCEEVPPFINFEKEVKSQDTSYITTNVPAAQHKAVLIEDITGVRCNNCPKAATRAKEIVAAKTKDSVVLIGLYTTHLANFTNPYDGFEPLTSTFSFQVVSFLGPPTGLPSGYVDRAIIAPQTVRFNPFTTWASLVNLRLKEKTPVNIELSKSLAGKNLNFKMSLVYTSAVSSTHKYALYITESKILSKQTMPDGAGEKDDYEHNHVLRFAFGLASGNTLNQTLVAGRVYERVYEYEFSANMVPENCHLVCVVTDANTNEVVNVREIDIKN